MDYDTVYLDLTSWFDALEAFLLALFSALGSMFESLADVFGNIVIL